jgi:hypothetical protein
MLTSRTTRWQETHFGFDTCAISRSACCTFFCDQLERAAWRHSIYRSIRICRCFALPWQTTVCGFAPHLVLIWKWNQALQKRGVVQGLAQPVDPALGDGGHHAVVPRHAGLAGGLFEDVYPQRSLAGVVYLQPRVELLGGFKRVVCFFDHVLIAACAIFKRVTTYFPA